jgi:hypothetical protein
LFVFPNVGDPGWLVADDGVLRVLDGVIPTPSGWSWPVWAFDTTLELVCELVIGSGEEKHVKFQSSRGAYSKKLLYRITVQTEFSLVGANAL